VNKNINRNSGFIQTETIYLFYKLTENPIDKLTTRIEKENATRRKK
jgi:hypothetical protein